MTVTRASVVAVVAGVIVCSLATASSATPPGKNGRVAFTRYVTGADTGGAIFTVSAGGRAQRQVTRPSATESDLQPDWSPSGSRIVFQREYSYKRSEIFSVKPDGSGLNHVDPGCPPGITKNQVCEELDPVWSPDGKRIAFGNRYGTVTSIGSEESIDVGAIVVINADGSNRRQLTQRKRPTSSEDLQPAWSPDGKRIAFRRENSTASPRGRRAIFVVNTDGSGVRRLTPWELDAGDHPDWSPDGRRILFRSPSFEFAGSDLYTVGVDGKGLKRLTRFSSSVEVLSASYSPDGKSIVFSRTGKGGLPDLYVMRSDGRDIRQITRTTRRDSGPDWGPAR